MTATAWLRRCPRGHTNVKRREGDQHYCGSCECHYAGSPLDARDHEFPVDDLDHRQIDQTPHRYAVLDELVRRCNVGDSGLKASEFDCATRQSAAASLSQLQGYGMVTKQTRATAARWAPTDKGRRQTLGAKQ